MAKINIFLLCLFSIALAKNPGVKMAISKKAIDTFKNGFIQVVIDNIGNYTVPEATRTVGSGMFSANITVSNLTVYDTYVNALDS
jgi:hypothetical protein